MSKTIKVTGVPDELHLKLKAGAAAEGLSLSEYLVRELRRIVGPPAPKQVRARIGRRAAAVVETSPVAAVRAERDGRK